LNTYNEFERLIALVMVHEALAKVYRGRALDMAPHVITEQRREDNETKETPAI
jgi:hypothetical protein